MHRQKIAAIDDDSTLFVHNLKTNDHSFQEPNANSVAWNTFYEDMLAFSIFDIFISIKKLIKGETIKVFCVFHNISLPFLFGFISSEYFYYRISFYT